ncbi:DUF6146 family protein [Kaistella palustris]|uniref:DUF6146 family protein n=1 Tax=Kaistella palustris TaxID=493376 RepID=UPI0004200EB3|nr:DUF6146 family protein [Kaistella palustris]
MKKILTFIILPLLLAGCVSQKRVDPNQPHAEIAPAKNDEGEWDLQVLDSQYDYFLNAVAKPMNMYSETYLKSKNTFLVTEWNSYYFSGRYPNIIESSISYDPQENYGLKFEYKLYQVFAYVNWKYGLRLKGLSATDIR